jgi:glycosyltransferase involved in cell wall biosynthesis
MKDNFFNVIIPTRNRLATLQYALKTVLKQNYQNFKIIISDNFSSDGTRDYIQGLDSSKIDYFNTEKNLSMSSNYEFAISKIKEGFVILIGDDDGLLPSALMDINNVINQGNILAIASNPVVYYWPEARPYENLLMVPGATARIKYRRSAIFLEKVLIGNSHYAELPMLYTGGVVHSSLIEKAKNGGQKFYNSFTPDVYSGIAIASVINEYVKMETPFAISGLSRYSNGQSQLGSNSDASIAKTFFDENDIPFFRSLGNGQVKSLHLLTLEAYLQSGFLRKNEWININQRLETVVAKAPKHLRQEIRRYLNVNCDFHPELISISQLRINLLSIKFSVVGFIQSARRFIKWDIIYVQSDICNVYEASQFVEKMNRSFITKLIYRVNLLKIYFKFP